MRLILLVALLLLASPAAAGTARATLDRTQATMEDEVTLTLTISGDSDAPELPSALRADFDVGSSGHASQVSIVNGRMSSSTRYTFSLAPKHPGTLTIPAIAVTVDGTRLATEPLQLVVAAADTKSRQSDDLYVTAELTPAIAQRTTAYVGEQSIYTVRVYARVNANCPGLELPEIKGAASYELGSQRQYRTRAGGDELSVVEVKRAVFAEKPGRLEIPAMRLTCTVERQGRRRADDFGSILGSSGTRRVVRSNPVALEIAPLPPAPAGFSGLVGDVTLAATLSKTSARQGDSVTLSLVTRGTADMSRAPEPSVELDDFKVYDDKPTLRADTSGAVLIGERTHQKALVPLSGGTLVVAARPITYFDPRTGTYAQASTVALTIEVMGDARALPPSSPAASVAAPPVIDASAAAFALRHSATGPLSRWLQGWRFLVVLALPLLVAGVIRARTSPQRRSAARSRSDVSRQAMARLGQTSDPGEMSRILRDLIRARTTGTGAVTNDEAAALLSMTGMSTELVSRVRALLAACESATYSGASIADSTLRDEAIAVTRAMGDA